MHRPDDVPRPSDLRDLIREAHPLLSAALGSDHPHCPRVPDHILERELGRGGGAIVYLAHHTKLSRKVALKILTDHALVSRFGQEAEITANLDHPNIVKIYDHRQLEDSHVLFLEFVNGQSLKKKLETGLLTPQSAASIMRTVAIALHYAHKHGVIHRDLKPGNILLNNDDLPKVADFGLAKSRDGNHTETNSGNVIGTPLYMSPEQAKGHGKDAKATMDVYALGAVLYECLVGKVPFNGPTVPETLAMVCDQDPIPLRALDRNIPRDLETICLKCLSKNPLDRYQSAKDVADDLDRFLHEQPIVGRRPPLHKRFIRYVGRHPIWTTVIIAGFASVSIVFALSWKHQAELEAEVKNTETEIIKTTAALELSNKHFDEMRKLAKEVLIGVYDDIAPLPGSTKVRRRLVDTALTHFDAVSAENRNDPELLRELADAYLRLGDVLGHPQMSNLNDTQGARKCYERARDLNKKSNDLDNANPECVHQLVLIKARLGDILAAQGFSELALTEYNSALSLFDTLPKEFQAVSNAQYTHHLTQMGLATLYSKRGEPHKAMQICEASHAEINIPDRQKEPLFRFARAECLLQLGGVQSLIVGVNQALDTYRDADKIAVALHNEFENDRRYFRLLLECKKKIAIAQLTKRVVAEFESSFSEAISLAKELVQRDPVDANAKATLASLHLAIVQSGRTDDAWIAASEDHLGAAKKLCKDLTTNDPANMTHKQLLASWHTTAAIVLSAKRNQKEAEKNFVIATQLADEIVAHDSKNALNLTKAIATHRGYAAYLMQNRKIDEARAVYENNIKSLDAVHAKEPDNTTTGLILATDNISLGVICRSKKQIDKADHCFSKSRHYAEAVAKRDKNNVLGRFCLMHAYMNSAQLALDDQKNHANAMDLGRKCYRETVELLGILPEKDAHNRLESAKWLNALGAFFRQARVPDEAAQAYARCILESQALSRANANNWKYKQTEANGHFQLGDTRMKMADEPGRNNESKKKLLAEARSSLEEAKAIYVANRINLSGEEKHQLTLCDLSIDSCSKKLDELQK